MVDLAKLLDRIDRENLTEHILISRSGQNWQVSICTSGTAYRVMVGVSLIDTLHACVESIHNDHKPEQLELQWVDDLI